MDGVRRGQYSLAGLFVVTAVVAVLCAFAPFAYRSAEAIEWSSPTLGACIGWGGLVAAVVGVFYLFRR